MPHDEVLKVVQWNLAVKAIQNDRSFIGVLVKKYGLAIRLQRL